MVMRNFKNIVLVVLLGFALIGCNSKEEYSADNYYTPEALKNNLFTILPYIAKLENGVNYENRFDASQKSYFEAQQNNFKFSMERYFITPDSTHYFLIWKIAPSLYVKKIAIGGRYKKDKNGKIYAFEELFNTPKMKLEELKEKSFPLFDYMVKNGNVDKYIGDYLLVEFPDNKCVYDKNKTRWIIVDQQNTTDKVPAK